MNTQPVTRLIHRLAILLLALAFLPTAEAMEAPEKMRLIYFSSYPEIVQDSDRPGYSELAALIAEQRSNHEETYFIFGGASLGPSLLGALDRGAHMTDILNGLMPEFMAVMKREFSYGMDHLLINANASAFPMVTSNLVSAGSGQPLEGLEPYYLLEGLDLTVGFIVITSHNAVFEYGANETRVVGTRRSVQNTASQLKDLGADALFILADTDYDDLSEFRAEGLVDGIFYTHNFGNPQTLDYQGELLSEGPLDGYAIALDLWQDESGVLKTAAQKIALASYDPDPAMDGLITSYRNRLQERLSPPIATLATSFDTLRKNVRTGENAFGNFAADALRSHLDTDVFLLNSGAIRGNRSYSAGETINRGNIQRELPFGNRTTVLRMKGRLLRQTIEHGLDCASRADGCALQMSNLQVSFDSRASAGDRIQSIHVGDVPLDDDQLYTVGLSDFMAAGNDGFTWLTSAQRISSAQVGRALWDLIAEYCAEMGTVSPVIDGRLQDMAQTE